MDASRALVSVLIRPDFHSFNHHDNEITVLQFGKPPNRGLALQLLKIETRKHVKQQLEACLFGKVTRDSSARGTARF